MCTETLIGHCDSLHHKEIYNYVPGIPLSCTQWHFSFGKTAYPDTDCTKYLKNSLSLDRLNAISQHLREGSLLWLHQPQSIAFLRTPHQSLSTLQLLSCLSPWDFPVSSGHFSWNRSWLVVSWAPLCLCSQRLYPQSKKELDPLTTHSVSHKEPFRPSVGGHVCRRVCGGNKWGGRNAWGECWARTILFLDDTDQSCLIIPPSFPYFHAFLYCCWGIKKVQKSISQKFGKVTFFSDCTAVH